jgi:biopolymer transport protein ExbD
MLVHDSILFKDIGNKRIERLIKYYTTHDKKQIFIAIDEHKKYNNAVKILEQNKVIKLDKNNTLYNKIWSNKSNA